MDPLRWGFDAKILHDSASWLWSKFRSKRNLSSDVNKPLIEVDRSSISTPEVTKEITGMIQSKSSGFGGSDHADEIAEHENSDSGYFLDEYTKLQSYAYASGDCPNRNKPKAFALGGHRPGHKRTDAYLESRYDTDENNFDGEDSLKDMAPSSIMKVDYFSSWKANSKKISSYNADKKMKSSKNRKAYALSVTKFSRMAMQ